MDCDYLVVGSGLTGAVIARMLRDAQQHVLVVERRSHVGGNVHDHTHPSGISVHNYGPHYLRTNDYRIWGFLSRFSQFYKYEPIVKCLVDGQYENWPVLADYIRRTVGTNWTPCFTGQPDNFEEASLSIMPRLIYEKTVKGYTEKQWGISAHMLSVSLASRFDIRADNDPRLVQHEYQGLPEDGYSTLMLHMLGGIPVILNCDYLQHRSAFRVGKKVIFTGPIDEYFGYDQGHLRYRGQHRENEYLSDVVFAQPCGQVNNPDPANGLHIRTLEWKHMMQRKYAERIRGTVLTRESPFSPSNPDQYEYPFPDTSDQKLYQAYRQRADTLPSVLICGRLGEYRYYDMDQAIDRAMVLARCLMQEQ